MRVLTQCNDYSSGLEQSLPEADVLESILVVVVVVVGLPEAAN